MAPCKKQKALNKDRIPQQKKVDITEFQKGCLASIVLENIKLVYLRRSLVEKLLVQQSDNFEDKVVGSFIGVKRESGNGSGRKSYHLLQVTGISGSNSNEMDSEDEEEREELLFKEYLEIIMEQEGLAIDDLHSAQLKIEQYNGGKKRCLKY
ncbi:hypothetical protein SLE2022_118410 [Rubroshorea leprosula]